MSVRKLVLIVATLTPAGGFAQVIYPAKPEQADVWIRYRIIADRDERIRQFREMTRYFDSLKFVPAEREDADLDIFDPTAEFTNGTIPTENVAKLLGDPRVKTVLFAPAGWEKPAAEERVQVRLRIAGPLEDREQRKLHQQIVRHLGLLGFAEGISYDTAGYRLIRGSLPSQNLLDLLRDLRGQPSGWFLAAVPPAYLPSPLRTLVPVRIVEVLPDPAEPMPPFQVPALAPDKLTDDLRAVISDPARQNQPLRVEAILEADPVGEARDLRLQLQTRVGRASLDGIVGVVASIRLSQASELTQLAALPAIRSLRLPRAGHDTLTADAAMAPDPVKLADLLVSSKVANLHRLGYKGEGVRIAIIGTRFLGAEDGIGKEFPADTRIIDLTAELTATLEPLPPIDTPASGTLVARTVHAVAPAAELTLIRVDPESFHQLLTVAQSVAGSRQYSVAMLSRSVELVNLADELQIRRERVVEEYRQAFADLSDDPKPAARRQAAAQAMEQLLAGEKDLRARFNRLSALKEAIDALAGVNVVVNTLVWESGYPLDGLSELSRYLSVRFAGQPPHAPVGASKRPDIPVWVQAGSGALGRIWAGPFLDADGNGIMEFASQSSPRPEGRWSRELNFLRYSPTDGMSGLAIAANTKFRITIQWREPHPLDQVLPADPVFPFTLRLLRQLDPQGTQMATDEFVEVARSTAAPVRLMKTATSGVYERSLDVTIPADGVYALRVDGSPAVNPLIPALETGFELYPRIVIDPIAEEGPAAPTVFFDTFAPRNVGVGIPGDARAALTVGVGQSPAYEIPLSLTGAGPSVALAVKPELLSAGTIVVDSATGAGPGMATGFAGGVAAVLESAGVRGTDLVRAVNLRPGGPLVLPDYWLAHLRPRTAKVGSER